jgi:hypothetical protein
MPAMGAALAFSAWLLVTNESIYGLLPVMSIPSRLLRWQIAKRAVAERWAKTLTPSGLPGITRQHLVFEASISTVGRRRADHWIDR